MSVYEKKEIEKIRKEYLPQEKELTDIEKLRALEKKVKNPVINLVIGIIGSLILGLGMCLAMKVIGRGDLHFALGIIIGLLGIAIVSINYPIYKRIVNSRKNKYRKEILELTEKLLNQ